jgi:hypothetical protein
MPRSIFTDTRRTFVALAVVTVTAFASCSAVLAQSNRNSRQRLSLPSGTVIPVKLDTELSSNNSSRGDTFTTTVDNNKSGYANMLDGATVKGVVNDVQPRNGDNPGTLDVGFTSIHLSDGRTISISGSLTSMDPKKVDVGSDGIITAKTTNKNNRLTYAGLGAGAGALVSLIGGGKLKIEDILLGGLAGYGAATVIKGEKEVHDVNLQPGTPMGVLVRDSVNVSQRYNQGNGTSQYHQTNSNAGTKYYTYNGQPYAMNLSTGERYPVSQNVRPTSARSGKYYTYQGHPYFLDTNSGVRSQLD